MRHRVSSRPFRRRLGLALAWAAGVLLTGSGAWALQVSGLESPHSFLADPASRSYFISNINGEPDARDNNGFITKLSDDGRITAFKFIEGGQGDVTLHAPKGMAVVDQVLYVTDLDSLRAFDKTSGKPLATLVLPARPMGRSPSRSSASPPTATAISTWPTRVAMRFTGLISRRRRPSRCTCQGLTWRGPRESP
ncbi:MAG: hypothetical protein H8K06_09170 [Nitrospira sp.]|nr:hypothetical protein [Nitrospira sp.]